MDPQSISGTTASSPSVDYGDYGVCYGDEGYDVTNTYGDGVDTAPAGDTKIATADAQRGSAAQPAADPDAYGACEMSDEQLAAQKNATCEADAADAQEQCRQAHLRHGQPWADYCDEAAQAKADRCKNDEPAPACEPLSMSCPDEAPKAAAKKAQKAYDECVTYEQTADDVFCADGDTAVTGDGREVSCKDYRRYGENAGSVTNSRDSRVTSEESSQESKGGSRTTSGEAGWKMPVGWNGGVKHEENSNWNRTSGHKDGRSQGEGESVTEQRRGRAGWEATCQDVRDQTYDKERGNAGAGTRVP